VHVEGDTFHVFHDGRHTVLEWLDPLAHASE
jgi:3-methylcrotonyl-CoA carboxylase alpha subunit